MDRYEGPGVLRLDTKNQSCMQDFYYVSKECSPSERIPTITLHAFIHSDLPEYMTMCAPHSHTNHQKLSPSVLLSSPPTSPQSSKFNVTGLVSLISSIVPGGKADALERSSGESVRDSVVKPDIALTSGDRAICDQKKDYKELYMHVDHRDVKTNPPEPSMERLEILRDFFNRLSTE
ncbi:hypothetical protein HDU67_008189 [Dinochytrium kinnereticum]|nr:hypothetical protein HDU67_008189 [Dinochytrium kinnereticum]